VIVSSVAHYSAPGINYEAIRKKTRSITGLPEYAVSKLANVLHGQELARRLEGTRRDVVTRCTPGPSRSNVVGGASPGRSMRVMKLFMKEQRGRGARNVAVLRHRPQAGQLRSGKVLTTTCAEEGTQQAGRLPNWAPSSGRRERGVDGLMTLSVDDLIGHRGDQAPQVQVTLRLLGPEAVGTKIGGSASFPNAGWRLYGGRRLGLSTGRDAIVEFLPLLGWGSPAVPEAPHRVGQPEIGRHRPPTLLPARGALMDLVLQLEFGVDIRGAAFYEDTYVKVDGEWKIESNRLQAHLRGNCSPARRPRSPSPPTCTTPRAAAPSNG